MKLYRKITIKDERLFEKKMNLSSVYSYIKNYISFVEEFDIVFTLGYKKEKIFYYDWSLKNHDYNNDYDYGYSYFYSSLF